MKVNDLFVRGSSYLSGVVKGKPLKVRNMYSAADTAAVVKDGAKVSTQTITLRNAVTGSIVGMRSVAQK